MIGRWKVAFSCVDSNGFRHPSSGWPWANGGPARRWEKPSCPDSGCHRFIGCINLLTFWGRGISAFQNHPPFFGLAWPDFSDNPTRLWCKNMLYVALSVAYGMKTVAKHWSSVIPVKSCLYICTVLDILDWYNSSDTIEQLPCTGTKVMWIYRASRNILPGLYQLAGFNSLNPGYQ